MKRAWRERPRVVACQLVGLVVVLAVAMVMGAQLSGDDDVSRAAEQRTRSTERALGHLRSDLRAATTETTTLRKQVAGARLALARLRKERGSARTRQRAAERRVVVLRRDLRRARRSR